ncbi:zinc finger MYM-type protein 1-like [Aphis gossypii]|uniref:zinc finger MYM-type protein 1-like n=1 Tax=Aphis gossypii TaxID=80765 RepID=UPI002159ADB0|nr:zinc finger MYM-type protein 1-like [Aphis gossypii]
MTSEKKKMFPLFNLVVKKHKCSEEDDVVDNNPCQTYEDDTISAKDLETAPVPIISAVENHNDMHDIASFIKNRSLHESEIIACLKFTWEPPVSFAFPVQLEGNRTRKFQHKYLQLFPWLAYSKDKQGAFCKWCVIFANSGGGVGNQPLGKLVKIPMVKYKHCLTDLKNHAKTEYHLLSAQRANDFLHNYETGNEKAVNVLLDNRNRQVIEYNRKRLIPIVKTIIFCAQNNLALRGHREIGSIKDNDTREKCLSGEQGIFRALLSYRIECGDSDLLTHLETSKKNCTMISPTIQNEIIEAIRLVIQNKIVERVKTSKFYSILCDETTDVSTVEQLTLCVRYVDVPNCVIREDFLGFIKMESTTGIAIATAIQNELENIGLTLENLRGQGYDGGSNMSGVNNGVQSLILKKQPLAFYTHCLSHCLNLCLSKACNVPAIKNMMGTIQSVSGFFSNSAKRTEKLKSVIESTEISESNESSLIKKKNLKLSVKPDGLKGTQL